MSKYIGNELEIFENAHSWKSYFGSFIMPLLGKRVAEIGAGIGSTTIALCDGKQDLWVCVEPDAALLNEVKNKLKKGLIPGYCRTFLGYLSELHEKFDSILYIDVIEHIENDWSELEQASKNLEKGGRLFIIVPAHQSLYSSFDKQIGHYRRYDRAALRSIIPDSLTIEKLLYLDSAGYIASLVNKLFLKQSLPTLKQVKFWDRIIVPCSKITDWLLGYHFGKSILLVAIKK